MKRVAPCPNCGGTDQRLTRTESLRGMLPDAGNWITTATWDVVVCLDCGMTRYFAGRDALDRIAKSPDWQRT